MHDFENALSKAMKFCSTKEVCISEITQKLEKWNIDKKHHKKIISILIDEDYINEQRYAEAFTSDKFRFQDYGKIKIRYELRLKKIENEYINNALEIIDDESYFNKIEKLIASKLKTAKETDAYKLKAKIQRYLLSKGYEQEYFGKIINKINFKK